MEYGYVSVVIPLVARITGKKELLDVARETGEVVLESPLATAFFAIMATAGLGIMSALLDDVSSARKHYAKLCSYRGTIAPPGCTSVDRVLGLLAQTMGDLEQAIEHFDDSMGFCRKAG